MRRRGGDTTRKQAGTRRARTISGITHRSMTDTAKAGMNEVHDKSDTNEAEQMTNMPSTIGTTEETTISTAIAIGKNRNGIIKHMTVKESRGQMSCGAVLTRSMGLIRDCGRIGTHRHRHTQPCHVALTHMSTDARSHMTAITFNRREQNATAHHIGSGKALQADGYRVKTRPSGSNDMTMHRPIFCTQKIRKMPSQDIIIYRPRHHLCVKDSKWIGERKERKATTAYRSATVKMRRCRHSRTIGKCLTV